MKALILVSSIFLAVGVLSGAVVSLNMSTLPSTQGWTYQANGPSHAGQAEASVWSTDGTTLSMNTLGSGLVSPSSNGYVRTGVVNAIDPIVVNWRSRVITHETTSSFFGWSTHFATGAQSVAVGFGTSAIFVGGSSIPFLPNTSAFHDYRIEFTPGASTFSFFVDNALFGTGVPSASTNNQLFIGDGSGAGNASAQMTSYSFSQVVPEPSRVLLLLLGALGVVARRRRA